MLNPCMGPALGSFQHRVTRRITWRYTNQREDGGWEYPPLGIAMEETGCEYMVDAEYGRAVHHNSSESGPLQEVGAEARGVGC